MSREFVQKFRPPGDAYSTYNVGDHVGVKTQEGGSLNHAFEAEGIGEGSGNRQLVTWQHSDIQHSTPDPRLAVPLSPWIDPWQPTCGI